MAEVILMPKQGNTVETCTLVQWKKKVGDTLQKGEVLCEIETDKSTIDVESSAEGEVLALLYEDGDDVPVQHAMAIVGRSGEDIASLLDELSVSKHTEENAPAQEPIPVSASVPKPQSVDSAEQHTKKIDDRNTVQKKPVSQAKGQRIKTSPRARRLAHREQVELVGIIGTGPRGLIIERDVQLAMSTGTARRKGDGAGVQFTVQVFTLQAAVNIEKITRICTAVQALASVEETIGIDDMIIFAVVRTLGSFPKLNAVIQHNEAREQNEIHIGYEFELDRASVIYTIAHADTLSVRDIAKEIQVLREDLEYNVDTTLSPTFMVESVSHRNIEFFTPMLSVNDGIKLGIGALFERPVRNERQEIEYKQHIGLSLSANVHIYDKNYVADFFQALSYNIEHIDIMYLY